MTTGREFGLTYSPSGELIQPKTPFKLNGKGAKFVKGFASIFDFNIVEVQEGFTFESFSPGANGTVVSIDIPTEDGKICKIPIDIEDDDYFLPLS